MASFLQNNGDILLDAVLTDYGRKLLAKGDGSFSIAKFSFADDEIDYTLYDNTEQSLNKDAEIMKTPILEAITNNAASMKSPLITLSAENILFLPSMKLSFSDNNTGSFNDGLFKGYVIPVDATNIIDQNTLSFLTSSSDKKTLDGVLNSGNREIMVDNGIDSSKLSWKQSLKDVFPMMYETEFNIYIDDRFASIGKNNAGVLNSMMPLSVDDDSVAIYKVSNQTLLNGKSFVSDIPLKYSTDSTIKGTRGTRIMFTLVPTIELSATDTLFDKYGIQMVLNQELPDITFNTIRTSVTVEGITTGCSIEIPILFAKVIL